MYAGPARLFTLVFGILYAAVAAIEAYLGWAGTSLVVGNDVLLAYSLQHNIVHWAAAAILLGSLAFGRWPAKLASQTIGWAFLVVALVGLLAPVWTAGVLGHGLGLPWTYHTIHILTAAFGLFAGYSSHAERYMVRTRTA